MKHFQIISLITLAAFAGCDKVPPRVPPPPPDCVLKNTIVKTNTAVSGTRKVLLEDYTGHTCGNCPPAAKKAEEIAESHDGKVIVLANHVSKTFAAPKINDYFEDFRDPTSTEWDTEFGMAAAGLPKGSVNRVKVSNAYPLNYSAWAGQVETELSKPQSVKLDVTTTYDPDQKLLRVKVFTTFKTNLNDNVNLSIVLSQDSIVADQKDYAPPSGTTVVDGDRRPDYRFDHIMVKSLNGTWGNQLKSAPISVNDTISITKDCNLVTKCFYQDKVCVNDKHLSVVVFAYNVTTKEILQVEKVKIR